MSSYHSVLKNAQARMEEAGYGEQSALLYMLELTNKEAHNLYMEFDEEMQPELEELYEEGIQRLLTGIPLGHVLGFEWFYGYRFTVNEEHFSSQDNVMAVDIGTGSGAIAVSLKKEEPNLHMMATDISEQAVAVAKKNADDNEAIVNFMVGDMLQPLIDRNLKVDILISNPPYIPREEEMEHSVVDYEPHVALFGGEDGLKFYRIIFENAAKVLKERAMMAFEMGYNQKEALSEEAKKYFPNARIEVLKDMSGKNRMLFVYLNMEH